MFPKNLEMGDLVWAKMKNFPHWPAKIVPPPATKSASSRKSEKYVRFFGTGDHAWISNAMIEHHSEEMVNSCKKKRSGLQTAIDEIIEAARDENTKPKDPNKSANDKFDELSKASPKKEKIRKLKNTNSVLKPPKKRASNNDGSRLSTPKIPRMADDAPTALSASPNPHGSLVAVIRPNSMGRSSQSDECSESPSPDVGTKSESPKKKHVPATDKKIGFLGLGKMGRGIVKNLLSSGHKVVVWNRTPSKCDDFVKEGALKAQTPSEVVQAADITFCCISDAKAVKAVVFGGFGVLQGLEQSNAGQKGYVEMSSIDCETSQEIAEAISIKGGRYLEAPITGNRQLAEEGKFVVLGAGDRSLFLDCETCFHAMSEHVFFLSCDVGKSSKFSLIISMFMGTVCGALAEGLALAKQMHVNQKELLEVLEFNGLSAPLIMEKGRNIYESKWDDVNTSLKHQQKNVNLGLLISDVVGQPMSVSASANELYKHAKLLGYSEQDMAAVYQGVKF